jgi:hypothetical protein
MHHRQEAAMRRPPIPLRMRLWGWVTLLRASLAVSSERCTHTGSGPLCFGCAVASTVWTTDPGTGY